MNNIKLKICKYLSKRWGKRFLRAYLKKYIKPVIEETNNSVMAEIKNRQVWTMWLQEDVPELCQVCFNSIHKYYPEAIIITEKNVDSYIDIPETIWNKYRHGIMKPAFFSDYIRVKLLDKYGGLWIDATCFMTQYVPEYIWKSDFFVLKRFDGKNLSNYFIYSNAHNRIAKAMSVFLEKYWLNEDEEPYYFFFHLFLRMLVKYDAEIKKIWNNIPVGLNYNTKLFLPILYDDFDSDIYSWLQTTSYLHKLTYRNFAQYDINENSYYRKIKQNYLLKNE